jgi:hypothetical protein
MTVIAIPVRDTAAGAGGRRGAGAAGAGAAGAGAAGAGLGAAGGTCANDACARRIVKLKQNIVRICKLWIHRFNGVSFSKQPQGQGWGRYAGSIITLAARGISVGRLRKTLGT